MTYRNRTADVPAAFSDLAPANTATVDPDFGAYIVIATDKSTNPSSPVTTFTMGPEGNHDAWNTDDTMLLVGTGGGGTYLLIVDPDRIQSHSCSPANPCVTYSGIRTGAADATHLAPGGNFVFSRKPGAANIILEQDTTGYRINKLVVSPSGTCGQTWCITRTLYVDFRTDTPVPCSVLASDYTVGWIGIFASASDDSVAFALGGGADWHSNQAYTSTETFLYPLSNSTNCGTAGHCNGFQLTTPGTSGSTQPAWATNCPNDGDVCTDGTARWTNVRHLDGQDNAFDIVSYRPGLGCSRLNTRIGKVYRGTGNTQPAGSWLTDNASICSRFGGGSTCTLPDLMLIHDGGQHIDPNIFGYAPPGAGGPNCLVAGQCSCLVKPSNPSSTHEFCGTYYWQIDSRYVRPCLNLECLGHSAKGYLYDYRAKMYTAHNPYNPTDQSGTAPLPGTRVLSNTATITTDQHGTYRNAGTSDATPVFLVPGDCPAMGRTGAGQTAAYYQEVVAGRVTADGSAPLYRFAHNYNTGSNQNFGVKESISVVSQTGRFLAVSTDLMGTRGSMASSGATCGAGNIRGDYAWSPTTAVSKGDRVYPSASNAENNIFQATQAGSTAGSSPNWHMGCPAVGQTCKDGTVIWTTLGPNTCRGDIVIVDLASAHPL